jgi:putative phosphoribosyl transferase
MYFANRAEAGKQLAKELEKYQNQQCAVIALSDGGAMVGAQIAKSLHCVLMMLLTEPIELPGEPEPLAVIDQEGGFTYNSLYSTGQLEDLDMDYHQFIEESKLDKLHKIHHLLGQKGLIEKDLITGHIIILVSDGLSSGFSLDAAVEYLKTIKVEKIIVASALATIQAVDRMHILADEIHCLSVVENYINTNHYYENNAIPKHSQIVEMIENIVNIAEKEKKDEAAAKKSGHPRPAKKQKSKLPEDEGLLKVWHDS